MDGYFGLAGHVNGSRADVDVSLSLLALRTEKQASTAELLLPPASMTALDAGVTLSPASQQELRLGVLSDDRVRLTLGYRWLGPWWLISTDLLYWPGDAGARLLAALRF